MQPIDTRRDEFRKYLERTGVLDMFTKVLSKLMTEEEKPEDAIEFIRSNLGDSLNDKNTIESLTQKLEDANQLIEELRAKLSRYEPMDVAEVSISDTVSESTVAAGDQEMPDAVPVTPASSTAEQAAAPVAVETPPKAEEPPAAAKETPKEASPAAAEPVAATVESTPAAAASEEPAVASPAAPAAEPSTSPAVAVAPEGEKKTEEPAAASPAAAEEGKKEEEKMET